MNQLHPIPLTAQQLDGDLVLEDVTVEDTPRDETLTLEMTNRDSLSIPTKVLISRDLSMVAVDDGELHVFEVRKDGTVFVSRENDLATATMTLPVPAGTYYFVPGSFGQMRCFALLESVKAGRQGQLDAAGVPKLTVEAGGSESLTFDAQAALDAVMSVGGDLVEPCCGGD